MLASLVSTALLLGVQHAQEIWPAARLHPMLTFPVLVLGAWPGLMLLGQVVDAIGATVAAESRQRILNDRFLGSFGVCAIAIQDPQYRPRLTMTRIAGVTQRTNSASGVDLSDDTLPDQIRRSRSLDNTNELVTDRPIEAGVSSDDLEIGVTDPRLNHTNQSFAIGFRFAYFRKCDLSVCNSQCFHDR